MRGNHIIAGVVVAMLLSGGCARTYQGPPPVETFTPRIADNRLKFFVYTWHFREPNRRPSMPTWPGAQEDAGVMRRDHAQLSADMFEEFRTQLRARLENNGYCREGYFELSHLYLPGEFRIRGECRDLATEEDRRRFPEALPPETASASP